MKTLKKALALLMILAVICTTPLSAFAANITVEPPNLK